MADFSDNGRCELVKKNKAIRVVSRHITSMHGHDIRKAKFLAQIQSHKTCRYDEMGVTDII